MARLTAKSLDDVLEDIRTQLQDSTMTEVYQLTYFVNTTQYDLPGYKTADPRILEIVSIEGPGYSGDYLADENLVDPTDYSLWNGYGGVIEVSDGYGAASRQQLYTGINISTLTFQDNSTVHITFRWQNPDFRPILTNFAGTSRLRMILSASATVLQQYLVPIADTVNSFGITSSGDDLRRLLGLVGGEVTEAVATTGKIELTNNSGDPFVFNSSMRFAAISSGAFVLFQSVTGSGTIADGDAGSHSVIAVDAGTIGNVGSYSITKIFSDDTLATELTTSSLTMTNPPVIFVAGTQETNYFDNGVDEETDTEIRSKIELAFQSLSTSSYSTIESAVLDMGTVQYVVVYDRDLRKGVVARTFEVWVAPISGIPFSPTVLSQIRTAVNVVKPVSMTPIVKQVPHTYLTFDMTIYADAATLADTSTLSGLLTTTMTTYINDRQIGEDVLPSTMLSLAKGNAQVKDVEMTEVTLTEFVSELNATSSEINIYNTASNVTEIYIKIDFNSIQKTDNMTYEGTAYYETSPDIIDERIDPTVKKAILGDDNTYRSDPREGGESGDYFDGVSGTQINFTGITNDGQELLIDWNAIDNVTLHGIRVWLKATAADSVDIDIWQVNPGQDPEGTGWAEHDTDTTRVTKALTGDGVAQLYEFEFAGTVADFAPDTYDYWIYLRHNGSPSGVITMPVDNYTEDRPQLWADGDVESPPSTPDTTFTRQFLRAIYETYTKFTGVNSYQKIIIPSASYEPEKPQFRSLALTFTAFTEE
jgi:phage-related baseplate assembly protein